MLAATDQLEEVENGAGAAGLPQLDDYIVVGELGLVGDVRQIRGALYIAGTRRGGGNTIFRVISCPLKRITG